MTVGTSNVTNISRKKKLEEWKHKKMNERKNGVTGGFLRRRSRSVGVKTTKTPYAALRRKLMTKSAVKAPPQSKTKEGKCGVTGSFVRRRSRSVGLKTTKTTMPHGSEKLKRTLESMRSPFRSVSKRVARKNFDTMTKRSIKHRTISTPMQKKIHKRNKNRRYNANQVMMWTSDFEVAVLDIDCKINAKDFHNARKILTELEKNTNMTKIDMKQKPEFWRVSSLLTSFEGDNDRFDSLMCDAEKCLSSDAFQNMKIHFETCRSRLPKKVISDSPASPAPSSPPTAAVQEENDDAIGCTPTKVSFMKCATPSSSLKRPVALGLGGSARRIFTPSISRGLDSTVMTNEDLGSARRVLTGKKPPRSSRKSKQTVVKSDEGLGMYSLRRDISIFM